MLYRALNMASHDRKLAVPLALLAGFALGTNPQVRIFGMGGGTTSATHAPAGNSGNTVQNAAMNPAPFADGRLGAESPELRLLRIAELQMFDEPSLASHVPKAARDHASEWQESSEDDDSMSSFGDGAERTDFLSGLDMPDLPVTARPEIRKYVRYFAKEEKGRRTFASWLKRSGAYRPIFAESLGKQKLPKDLEAVSFIESGLWPTARSSAGAVGLWQFMPQTARAYGLTVTEQYDERLSIWASTEAASEHLGDLHQRFKSWELALAAYNLGYQGLERRMKEYAVDDFWELAAIEGALPRETRLYVPKVLAVALLLNNLDKFGFASVELAPALKAGVIEVPRAVPLSIIARAAGTSVRRLREYNPDLRADVTPDRGSPVLVRIPSSGVSRAKVMLPKLLGPEHDVRVAVSEDFDWGRDELDSDGRSRLERTNAKSSNEDEASSTDAPKELLSKTERAASAKKAEVALLPTPTPAPPTAPSAKSLAATAISQGLITDASAPTLVPESVANRATAELLYRVAPGDTLSRIARSFGYEYAEIARKNGLLDPSHVLSGQMLTLEKPARWEDRVLGRLYYRVKEGDTLDSIRKEFGLEPAPLRSRRGNFQPDALPVGQLLRLENVTTEEG